MSHFADDETLAHIAALELEVVRLREALTVCVCAMQDYQAGIGITEMFDKGELLGRKVLSTPFTPTALPELIEKVEKIWREKCASRLDSEWNGDADTYEYSETCNECAERIRALPVGQIKLEELL